MSAKDVDQELIDVADGLDYAAQCVKHGNLQEAEPIYRHALAVLERVYGAGDPDTLTCLQSLGDLYFALERYKEAVPLYRRLVIIGEKVFGKQHPNVIDMVTRLGATYEKLGLTADAETMYRRANQISEVSLKALEEEQSKTVVASNKSLKRGRNTSTRLNALKKEDYPDPDATTFKRSRKRIRSSDKMNPILDVLMTIRGYASMIFSVIVIIALFLCAYVGYSKLGTPVIKQTRVELKQLHSFDYSSGDGQITLSLRKGSPDYKILGVPVATTIGFYGPDLWEFKDTVANSLLSKEIWYEQVSVGLRSEDGSFLYSKDSPEFRVIQNLNTLQNQMQANFRVNRRYPTDAASISMATYINPVTGIREAPALSFFENPDASVPTGVTEYPTSSTMTLYNLLQAIDTPKWGLEPPPSKGVIHALSIFHGMQNNDIREFYAHGFDRNGFLIQGSKPNTVFLIGMHNNDLYPQAKVAPYKGGRPVKVCIIKPPSGTPLWLLHYFAPVFSLSLAILFFVGDKMSRPAGERWTAEKLSAMMRLCYVFAIVAAAYAISYFCP